MNKSMLNPPEREQYVSGGLKKIIEFGAKVIRPLNEGQEKVKKATEAQAVTAKAQAKAAGATAVTLGIGDLIYSNVSENEVPSLMKKAEAANVPFRVVDERINPEDYPVYKKDSDSAKAFRQAQRDAKKAGADFFEYEGRSYNTREKSSNGGRKFDAVQGYKDMYNMFERSLAAAETEEQRQTIEKNFLRDTSNVSEMTKIAALKEMDKERMAREGKAEGGKFPDLTGDGEVTQADVLKGRGVFNEGGYSVDTALIADPETDKLISVEEYDKKYPEKEIKKSLLDNIKSELTNIKRKLEYDPGAEKILKLKKQIKEAERENKAEGSIMMPPEGMPVDTYSNIPEDEMDEALASQLPDDEMEEDYIKYVMDESLNDEEQMYLAGALQNDDRLSDILDKVIATASEFSGAGEVDGPGTGVSDSIPARLSDGEFVFTKKATDQIGADQLQTMMDDAERAYDGGVMMAEGGMMDEEDPGMSKTKEEIEKLMMGANRMPSLR